MPWSIQGPYPRCYTKEKKRDDAFPPPSESQQQYEIGVEGVGVPLQPLRAGDAIPPCSTLPAKQV